jgi:uncharacterized protein DUF4388
LPFGDPSPRSSAPIYQTDLAQTPLPEILVTVHRYKAPGAIDCRRGDETKRIFLDQGKIIFASTNQLTESLGDRLVREGRITQAEYDASLARMKITGKRHGVTLVEMNLLTAGELFVMVRDQIQAIIDSVFGWTTGTIAFTPGRDKNLEFVKVEISVPDAIVRGARLIPDAKPLVARLGTKTTYFDRTHTAIEEMHLTADEQHLLDAVDGRHALGDLVATPPLPQPENARLLYAFSALGLIAPCDPRGVKVQVKSK